MVKAKNYEGFEIEVPETPYAFAPSCICPLPKGKDENGDWIWEIDPSCEYHIMAARQPWNHRIPRNCPTYYDGCNCDNGPYFP